jgi:DNA cross-link repair 1A protein
MRIIVSIGCSQRKHLVFAYGRQHVIVGPGSSLFLFEGRQTVNAGDSIGFKSPYIGGKRIWRYLHCGDFRACPQMVLHPAIAGKKIDTCYLDTTYLNPKYCFPPQPLVIDACATLARRSLFGRHLPAITEAGGGHAQKDGQLKPRAPEEELKPDAKREEEDVKSYLQGLEGLDMDETGRKWMDSWLVKNEEEVKEEVDAIQTKKTGRTLILMGSVVKRRLV